MRGCPRPWSGRGTSHPTGAQGRLVSPSAPAGALTPRFLPRPTAPPALGQRGRPEGVRAPRSPRGARARSRSLRGSGRRRRRDAPARDPRRQPGQCALRVAPRQAPARSRPCPLTRWPSWAWGSPAAPGSRGSGAASARRCGRAPPRAPWVSAGATRGKAAPPPRRPPCPARRQSAPGSRRAAEPRTGAAAARRGWRRGAQPCSRPWRAAGGPARGRPGPPRGVGRRRGSPGLLARARWHRLGPPETLPPPLHRPGPGAGAHRVPAAAGARLADSRVCGAVCPVQRKVPLVQAQLVQLRSVAFPRAVRCGPVCQWACERMCVCVHNGTTPKFILLLQTAA